jgi:hypothetical protein
MLGANDDHQLVARHRLADEAELFGDAVEALRDAFLGLSDVDLEFIFADYAVAHGESAASYARKTYQDWKYGRVKLSGKIMER